MSRLRLLLLAVGIWGLGPSSQAASPAATLPDVGTQWMARDSLDCSPDPQADAEQCLAGLRWEPTEFIVEVAAAEPERGDRLLRFPTPRPLGDAIHDRVALEWYAAKDADGAVQHAPAVVVVHESGRNMPVGRMIARALRESGLHALLLHLPGYGYRRTAQAERPELLLAGLQQGISDVRRARDAVAALPIMQGCRIGVQGTSLGGFVTSTVAGIDSGFDRTFILLAGGNLHDVLLNGKKDAAKIRKRLQESGVTDEQLRELAWPIEPLRLAHRIVPEQTWLYNGRFDDVVPRSSSYALAQAARLPAEHHVEMLANHYTGIIFLPVVIQQIHSAMTTADPP